MGKTAGLHSIDWLVVLGCVVCLSLILLQGDYIPFPSAMTTPDSGVQFVSLLRLPEWLAQFRN